MSASEKISDSTPEPAGSGERMTAQDQRTSHPEADPTPALRIGARLRRIRRQQGRSLADVEAASGGRWKAVVVGAYERGDRTATVERLAELAGFYGVPLADLLPDPSSNAAAGLQEDRARVVLDLTALQAADPHLAPIARFAEHVQHRRGDRNGQLLTLRGGDLETIALTSGTTVDLLQETLAERGALIDLGPDTSQPFSRR